MSEVALHTLQWSLVGAWRDSTCSSVLSPAVAGSARRKALPRGTGEQANASLASGVTLFSPRQRLACNSIFREQRHVSLQSFVRLREPVQGHIMQH